MKRINTILLVILLIIIYHAKTQTFLGFEQEQCTSSLDYFCYNFECSVSSYTYKILKNGEAVYEEDCLNQMGQLYAAHNILFVNESIGFHAKTHQGSNYTAYKYVVRSVSSGSSWSFFKGPPQETGPIMDFDYFVLNEFEVIMVALSYANGLLPNHIFINDIVDSIDNDTIFHYQLNGENLCGIDTLSFNIYGGNTVNYKLVLDFPTEIQESSFAPEIIASPNPTCDYVIIKTNTKFNEIGEVNLYDLNGISIISKKFENEIQLDLRNVTSGVYIAKIEINDDIIIKKIMIN